MAKEIPVGVKIIAVLYYIGAVLALLFGILTFVGAGTLQTALAAVPFLAIFSGLIIVLGIILIGFGVLGFFIGRGLWKAQNWARILVIIFAALGVLMAIIAMVGGNIAGNIVSLIINGLIGGYLLFSQKVKAAF